MFADDRTKKLELLHNMKPRCFLTFVNTRVMKPDIKQEHETTHNISQDLDLRNSF